MSFGSPVRNGLGIGLTPSTALSTLRVGGRPAMFLNFVGATALSSNVTFTRATTATFVGSNGLIQSAAIDAPRFDYDPVTLAAKGLLIEEQRTNLLLRSQEFDNASWAKVGTTTVTPNTAVAPDGTTTADQVIVPSGNNQGIQQSVALSTGSYRISVWARAVGTATTLRLASFTLDGTKITTFSLPVGVFVRYEATFTYAVGGTALIRIDTNDVGGTIEVWGAQLEAGAFATSYIPTVASQVTRSADVASMTGTNFSSWYNQSEGTFVASGDTAKPSGVAQTANLNSVNDGTSSNAVSLRFGTSSATGLVQTGGSAQTAFAGAAYTANTPVKWGMAYKLNDTALSVAGGAVTTDTSVTVGLTMTQMNLGARNGALDPINGHIQQIAYYNTRLPNDTLQALTA